MIKTLLSYVKEYKKASFLSIFFIAAETLIEIGIPFIMAMIIDRGLIGNNTNIILRLCAITVIMAIMSLFCGVMSGKYSAYASSGFAKNLRSSLYKKIQSFSFKNIDNFSTAGLITRFTTDVANIQNAYQMLIRLFIRAPFMLIFATLMTVLISGKLSLIYIFIIAIMSIIILFMVLSVHPIFTKALRRYDKINLALQENISAIRVVKSYVREFYEINKFNEKTKNLLDMFLKGEKIIAFFAPVLQFAIFTCYLLLSWFGGKMVINGNLSTGELMSLYTYTTNILMSVMMLAMVLVTLVLSLASGERIVSVLNEEPSIKNPNNPIKYIEDGSIEFKNVNFSYTDNEKILNLRNINIKIKSGETIGIIGGIGSSKSAFVQLIPRLYDVISGNVLVSGENVKNYDLQFLRDNVAMVLQKNVLFSGTIKENLRWGNKNATDEEIETACKLAQADEFIQKMPNKYDSIIERGGTNLSGGQRQRMCIARALLKNPKILILDDSTSAVDTKTDSQLRKSFKTYIPDVTKIIIAQRISSIEDADRIIVLDDGEISGVGTHDELIKNNLIYKEIYESQKKGDDSNE